MNKTVLEQIESIKANLSYTISENDSFDSKINNLIKKFQELNINLHVTGYDIVEFNNSFSKVIFNLKIENQNDIIVNQIPLLLNNVDFVDNILSCYKKIKEIYLVNMFDLKIDTPVLNTKPNYTVSSNNVNGDSITSKQFSYLRDKIKNEFIKNIVDRELIKFGIQDISELTKSQASIILGIIDPKSIKK